MFPVGTERGAPLRARVYKFDPMLFEIVISPSQKFFLDDGQSSGQGAWVFPVGTERGAPLRARVYKFDPMLFEIVISPSQKFFLDDD